MQDKLLLVAQTLIATALIFFAWDNENGVPVFQFALAFGGFLLGHVLTEVLNEVEGDDE